MISRQIFVRWIGLALLICLLISTTTIAQAPNQTQRQAADGEQRDVTAVRVESIAGKPTNSQDGFVFESLHEGQGVDVVIGGYAVKEEDDVFLLVKSQESQDYTVYGPARRQRQADDRVLWVITDVVLPYFGIHQRKHYVFRAAVAPRGEIKSSSVSSSQQFSAVSWPAVPVAVLEWTPKASELTIDLVDGHPIEPKLTVEASADITGSIERAEKGKVYLILHATNSNLWRVVGPAEMRGSIWQLRDVSLAEPGQPHWRNVDIFAFQSQQRFQAGPISYSAWVEKMVAASPSARLWVKDEEVTPPKQAPQAQFTRYLGSDGKLQPLSETQQGSISVGDVEISLQGTIQNLPQGKSLWGALNPLGSSIWLVQDGPGLLNGDTWTFPRVRLEAPSVRGAYRFRFVVIAADSALPMGAADYSVLQSRGAVISRFLYLDRPLTTLPVQSEITLSIASIGGMQVESSKEVNINGHGSVAIEAEGVPPGGQVWLARNKPAEEAWTFFAASLSSDENVWLVPDVQFGNQPQQLDEAPPSVATHAENFIAFVTTSSLPVQSAPFDAWRPYANAVSPVVKVRNSTITAVQSSRLPAPQAAGWSLGWSLSLTLLCLALILLVLLEFLFRLTSSTAGELQQLGESSCAYIQNQFRGVPRPNVRHTVVGLLLLGLGLFAIISYLPIYEHILQSSLSLSGRQSHSLALLLIIFIALTGVIADVTTHYGRGEQDHSDADADAYKTARANGQRSYANSKGNFTYVFGVSIVMLIAVALLMFQGILYFEFYKAHATEGSNIPFAFGAAALFIAGIEMLGFFWATRLSLDFISWTFLHLILFSPPWLLAKASSLVKSGFQTLPSRVKRSVSEPQPSSGKAAENGREMLSAKDARQLATVYVLTSLGDHLQPGTAEWLEQDQSWRFRVFDKRSKQERGELHIDGLTGAVHWQETVRKDPPHELSYEQPLGHA